MAGSSLTDFGPQLKSLAGPDLTLVAWDPPGYGQSRPPGRQFGPGFYREDALTAAALMQVTVEGWPLIRVWQRTTVVAQSEVAVLLASESVRVECAIFFDMDWGGFDAELSY